MKKLILCSFISLLSISGFSQNYETALKQLNNYLKTFNPETYKTVEVKDGKVFFYFFVFSQNFYSSIDISEISEQTTVVKGSTLGTDEIKIFCKDGKKCFYSSYSKGNTDHLRFFSNTVKDLSKMEELIKDFVKVLKQ